MGAGAGRASRARGGEVFGGHPTSGQQCLVGCPGERLLEEDPAPRSLSSALLAPWALGRNGLWPVVPPPSIHTVPANGALAQGPAAKLGCLPLGGQKWACPGGVRAGPAVPPFCILLLLNHKLYKMDGFCICVRVVTARRRDWAQVSADSTMHPPPNTHMCTHRRCILHLVYVEPAARGIVGGFLTDMYGPEPEAHALFRTYASCFNTF